MKDKNQILVLSGILLAVLLVIIFSIIALSVLIPDATVHLFGSPNSAFDNASRILYSAKLYLNRDLLLKPYSPARSDKIFIIQSGETAKLVSDGLSKEKLIKDPEIFTDYLVYKGIDRLLQAGTYRLSPGLTPVEIAELLYDATPQDVAFSFLAGWRAEEVAVLLPASGLAIPAEEFLNLVHNPPPSVSSLISSDLTSLEGYLFPASYQVLKSASSEELIRLVLNNFKNQLPMNYEDLLKENNLSLNEAIILASMVEKEAIIPDEVPLIASVFINRLKEGMPLQSDPTVQYALGYSAEQGTWWKNPLTSEDLGIDSPYNTYLHQGLPPAPICNPGEASLKAVLEPAQTDFLYFRAACDGSGRHVFSLTYEDHLKAACK